MPIKIRIFSIPFRLALTSAALGDSELLAGLKYYLRKELPVVNLC